MLSQKDIETSTNNSFQISLQLFIQQSIFKIIIHCPWRFEMHSSSNLLGFLSQSAAAGQEMSQCSSENTLVSLWESHAQEQREPSQWSNQSGAAGPCHKWMGRHHRTLKRYWRPRDLAMAHAISREITSIHALKATYSISRLRLRR